MRTSSNRIVAVVAGAAYVVIGVAGFFVAPDAGFLDTTGGLLLGLFQVNGLHSVIHVVIGIALVAAGVVGLRPAKTANSSIGAVFLLLGIVGLFVVGTAFNVLAINGADNVLHFGSAVVLLGVGLGAERDAPVVAR